MGWDRPQVFHQRLVSESKGVKISAGFERRYAGDVVGQLARSNREFLGISILYFRAERIRMAPQIGNRGQNPNDGDRIEFKCKT